MWLTSRVKKLVLFSISVGTGGAGGGGVAMGGGAISHISASTLEPSNVLATFNKNPTLCKMLDVTETSYLKSRSS